MECSAAVTCQEWRVLASSRRSQDLNKQVGSMLCFSMAARRRGGASAASSRLAPLCCCLRRALSLPAPPDLLFHFFRFLWTTTKIRPPPPSAHLKQNKDSPNSASRRSGSGLHFFISFSIYCNPRGWWILWLVSDSGRRNSGVSVDYCVFVLRSRVSSWYWQ